MTTTFTYRISSDWHGKTAAEFLQNEGYSRHLIVHLRHTPQSLTIDGQDIYTNHRLSAGECLTVTLMEETASSHIVPTPMPLSILFEDRDILVIDKAANTPIHPSQGHYENTLANGIAWYYASQGKPFIYRAINRLDRDTTGLLVIAKHMLSACILSNMVANHQIHRQYLAITEGLLPEHGTIHAPIAQKTAQLWNAVSISKVENLRAPDFQRLLYNDRLNCSLAAVRLETGRTHQIRVHMKYIQHPLPGDFLYNPNYQYLSRQGLHSWKLSFLHPITKEALSFTAPLPDDMAAIFPNDAIPLDNDF